MDKLPVCYGQGIAPYCPRCGSGEYLHNEDGNENNFCGQCGCPLDWTQMHNEDTEQAEERFKCGDRTNERRAEMERLTIPDEKIEGGVRRTVIDAREVKKNAMTIYWALKKYEDTGLTPEEVMELAERDTAKAPVDTDDEFDMYVCPSCDMAIGTIGDKRAHNFCLNCGQRLKWKED